MNKDTNETNFVKANDLVKMYCLKSTLCQHKEKFIWKSTKLFRESFKTRFRQKHCI